MAFDYAKTAKTLLELVGGECNVLSVTHCMTRLRFVLKDKSAANKVEIERTPGVLRAIEQGGQLQIVIGNEVSHVYNEVAKLGNFAETADSSSAVTKEKENLFSRLCGFVAGCMTPLLPAMLGCGMINVVLTLLTTFGLLGVENPTYIILSAMGDTFMYFVPIMLAYTAAKKVGMNPFVAMAIGAVLVHPKITALLASGGAIHFFGLPVTPATYSSSILPILMMVPIMAKIEKFADRICPNMVKIFLKPLIVILVSLPIVLVVIGPLGTIIGNYLAAGISVMYDKVGWLTIMLLSAFMPFIVMTGMHYTLAPLAFVSMATFGFDALLVITMYCSNIAQGSASLAVAVKTKDKELKSTAAACGVSAVVAGVTEPAMYGVTLKYKTPMIGAMIGAGAAGLFAGFTHLVAYTMGGSPSVLSLIQMIGGEGAANLMNGIIAGAITLVITFVVTYMIYKDPESQKKDPTLEGGKTPEEEKPLVERLEIASPLNGSCVPLSEMASEHEKTGIAIIPAEGKLYAPEDGTVTAISDSGAEIGFTTDKGTELSIHTGIKNAEVVGVHFKVKNFVGDHVKKGGLLLEFDIKGMKEAGSDIITAVTVSNAGEYVSIKKTDALQVAAGDNLLTNV